MSEVQLETNQSAAAAALRMIMKFEPLIHFKWRTNWYSARERACISNTHNRARSRNVIESRNMRALRQCPCHARESLDSIDRRAKRKWASIGHGVSLVHTSSLFTLPHHTVLRTIEHFSKLIEGWNCACDQRRAYTSHSNYILSVGREEKNENFRNVRHRSRRRIVEKCFKGEFNYNAMLNGVFVCALALAARSHVWKNPSEMNRIDAECERPALDRLALSAHPHPYSTWTYGKITRRARAASTFYYNNKYYAVCTSTGGTTARLLCVIFAGPSTSNSFITDGRTRMRGEKSNWELF